MRARIPSDFRRGYSIEPAPPPRFYPKVKHIGYTLKGKDTYVDSFGAPRPADGKPFVECEVLVGDRWGGDAGGAEGRRGGAVPDRWTRVSATSADDATAVRRQTAARRDPFAG